MYLVGRGIKLWRQGLLANQCWVLDLLSSLNKAILVFMKFMKYSIEYSTEVFLTNQLLIPAPYKYLDLEHSQNLTRLATFFPSYKIQFLNHSATPTSTYK
jgi:hypothetical protein